MVESRCEVIVQCKSGKTGGVKEDAVCPPDELEVRLPRKLPRLPRERIDPFYTRAVERVLAVCKPGAAIDALEMFEQTWIGLANDAEQKVLDYSSHDRRLSDEQSKRARKLVDEAHTSE